MNIICFTKYTRQAASSRMRSYQYFPFLEQQGFTIKISPLFNDAYLSELYTGRKISKWNVLLCYFRRLLSLLMVFRYQVVWIEKELFPYLPAWIEFLLRKVGVKYVVDYDDAIFHNYDLHTNGFIRSLLADKIDRVMRYSGCVIAGNDYLATRAKNSGAEKIEVIPTVIDINRYPMKAGVQQDDKFVIGWIGTKSTFEKYFMLLEDMVQHLTSSYSNLIFHIVGVENNNSFNDQVRFFPWYENTEVEQILRFDVGLMPLLDSPWERGKCAYKLIQYMACGVPGVASRVGANTQVVNFNNGFLADNISDFKVIIEEIMTSREILHAKSNQARKDIEDKYTLQVQEQVLFRILKDT